MNKHSKESSISKYFSLLSHGAILTIDQTSEYIYDHIEIPLQNACYYFGNLTVHKSRQGILFNLSKDLINLLVQSYLITFFLYFILLFFAQIFFYAIQRYYFIDPFLSTNRQCINIQFVHNNNELISNNTKLKENFLRENSFIKNESYQKKENLDYTQFYHLLDLLENNHYMICQRSLYLYSRFHVYSSLLHSNQSQFRFSLSKYFSSFTFDQPPFLDLCVHTNNHSQIELVKSRLLPLSTYYYSSINLFFFNFNFTEVTITLYELNKDSTHLERVSIHSGWLFDIYSQVDFIKYLDTLSTVLFDGFALGQQSVDYFNYTHIPVPADTILGLNEMIQQTILILPLCQ